MNPDLKDILSQIQGEKHLCAIFDKKKSIIEVLIQKDYSLLDIYRLKEHEYQDEKKKIRDTINAFKIKTQNDPEYFLNYYKYVLCAPIEIGLGFEPVDCLATNLIDSLKEIVSVLRIKAGLPHHFFDKTEFNSFLPLSEYIAHYFGLDGQEESSFKTIGEKYGKTAENIRTNLFDHKTKPDLRSLFLKEQKGYGLKVNSQFLNNLKNVFDTHLYRSNFLENFSDNEFPNPDIIRKLLSIFSLDLIEVTSEQAQDNYYVLSKKKDILLYRSHLTLFDKVFREGKYYKKKDLIKKLTKEIPSLKTTQNKEIKIQGVQKEILDALLDDYIKLEIRDIDSDNDDDHINTDLYQFKWEYLSSVTAKVERILIEEDGSMHNTAILESYNERASDAGLKELTISQLTFRRTDKIRPIGKSGRWVSISGDSITNVETLQDFIDDTIFKKYKGKVEFETLKSYLNTTHYAGYPDSSIRAYILNCSRKSIDDNNLFIHENCLGQYPEINVVNKKNQYFGNDFIKTVIKIIESDRDQKKEKRALRSETMTSLNNAGVTINTTKKFDAYLKKFIDAGIIVHNNINGKDYYSIDTEELEKHDLNRLGKQVEPEYRKNIRAHAINYLKRHDKVKLSALKDETKHLLPKRTSLTYLYKIFDEREIFIKEDIDNQKWISLDRSLLPKPQELHIEVKEEATELLGNMAFPVRLAYDRELLKEKVIKELFSEVRQYKMNKAVLANNFDLFYEAILDVNGKPSRWGDSLLQSLFELLNTKTDYYDRETCLNKLILGYETYLKCFIPDLENQRFSGQVDVINSFTDFKEVWTYKFQENRTNKQKNNFSYILHSLKFLSDQLRHNGAHESLDMGLNKQIKNAIDFIALYLFTAQTINNELKNMSS
ncbi:hypothetical protein [Gelidibacter maritimus]|uniref:Uncharacterized protein n=1 Tax=Gelidibacter maritimus TaxID=2761487 RepID=A0A7W2M2E5_9FLAO|nr:hypothetical protein [Gelidibacter maritimus]MBA6151440.1 hypothetical protein [Gelidibacter maritimus]